MPDSDQSTSKFLSLVLRHDPGRIGLSLDENGWAQISDLLAAAATSGKIITPEQLKRIVSESDKQRFLISEDGLRIRANQGHSISVDLQLAEVVPPATLFHGTAARNLDSILEKGILKGQRHHVHLSQDEATARKVGERHGKPVILLVQSESMNKEGYKFYQSQNGVWLTDWVPPAYLKLHA